MECLVQLVLGVTQGLHQVLIVALHDRRVLIFLVHGLPFLLDNAGLTHHIQESLGSPPVRRYGVVVVHLFQIRCFFVLINVIVGTYNKIVFVLLV